MIPVIRLPFFLMMAVIGLQCSGAAGPSTYDGVISVYESTRGDVRGVAEVSIDDVLAMDRDSVIFVDVREPRERDVSMIPGAITLDELDHRLADPDMPQDALVVTYCTVGVRSVKTARELSARGIRAANLRGSILAWVHRGQPVVNTQGTTPRVHVYGRRWNLVPEGIEAVW